MTKIDQTEGGLEKFSRGYEKFGFTFADNGDIVYREWWWVSSLLAYQETKIGTLI